MMDLSTNARLEGPGAVVLQNKGSHTLIRTPNTARQELSSSCGVVDIQIADGQSATTDHHRPVATECNMHATYNAGVI